MLFWVQCSICTGIQAVVLSWLFLIWKAIQVACTWVILSFNNFWFEILVIHTIDCYVWLLHWPKHELIAALCVRVFVHSVKIRPGNRQEATIWIFRTLGFWECNSWLWEWKWSMFSTSWRLSNLNTCVILTGASEKSN